MDTGWRPAELERTTSPALVVHRLRRVTRAADEAAAALLEDQGLGLGDADTLAALLSAGPPYALSPGRLSATTGVTTGAATKRIDRLDRRGLITRRVSPGDTRGRVITLTAAGRALAEVVVAQQDASRQRLLQPLTSDEVDTLGALLGRLLEPVPHVDAP